MHFVRKVECKYNFMTKFVNSARELGVTLVFLIEIFDLCTIIRNRKKERASQFLPQIIVCVQFMLRPVHQP